METPEQFVERVFAHDSGPTRITDLAAAIREDRARVLEEAARIAASFGIYSQDPSRLPPSEVYRNGVVDGIATEIRAEAARLRAP